MRVARREVLAHYVAVEMSKEIDRAKLDAFVAGLSEAQLSYLVRVLSRYRENAVARILFDEPLVWELVTATPDQIDVTDVNETVEPLLRRNRYNLGEIAEDEELCTHPEFDSRGRPIAEERTIGVQDAGRIKIIDGMHRIIRMACNGRREFPVYVGRRL